MYKITKDFFKQNNLGEWPNTQLLLFVKYHDDGSKALFDPQSTATRGYMDVLKMLMFLNTKTTALPRTIRKN